MLRRPIALGIFLGGALLSACSSSQTNQSSLPSMGREPSAHSLGVPGISASGHSHKVCGDVGFGFARCYALERDDLAPTHLSSDSKPGRKPGPTPTPAPTPTPGGGGGGCSPVSGINGYQPCDLRSAYNLPSATAGSGMIVAIVDAYDDPNAESDVNNYRSTFGIPACTTSNGCFRKVNQTGGTAYPTGNASWGQEISLDLDMVSAICPNCHILLVEGSSASSSDLATAVDEAAALGANAISNSYGSAENNAYDSHYNNHSGIAITASSGDSGYGTQSPASAINVTAVGGTNLQHAANARGWSETAWTSAGSGCSTVNAKQTWQSSINACGSFRGEADVAAVADPNTGVAVYDSYGSPRNTGWLVFGGTSVASPVIGSVYALAGAGVSNASKAYANTGFLFDVTSGSNGSCGTNVCNAATGWDGPTGLGTPNGIGAF